MTEIEDRFWVKVDKRGPDECWTWLAGKDGGGYGAFAITRSEQEKAHRFAYELMVGPITDGLHIDHLCRNRACVNPRHLEPVPLVVNVMRGMSVPAMNARVRQCAEGHQFSVVKSGKHAGRRYCAICGNARRQARRKAAKEAS